MLRFNAVLHPTDFSDHSAYALSLASTLARDHGARLVIMHTVLSLGPEMVTHGEAISERQPAAFQQKLWGELRQLRPLDTKVPVEHFLAEGDPAEQILRVAADTNADLIVMATHGRTGLQRLLMGSVAEAVMRKAPCPVLVVKSPHFSSPYGSG